MRIRTWLMLVSLLAVVPALAVGVLVIIADTHEYVIRLNKDRLEARSRLVSNLIEDWHAMTVRELQRLAELPAMVNEDPSTLRAALQSFISISPKYDAAVFVSADGSRSIRSDDRGHIDYRDRRWFRQAVSGQGPVTEYLISRSTGRPSIIYAAPVRRPGGEVAGVVFVVQGMERIAATVGAVPIGKSGFVLVITDAGEIIGSLQERSIPREVLGRVGAVATQHVSISDGVAGERWLLREAYSQAPYRVVAVMLASEAEEAAAAQLRTVISVVSLCGLAILVAMWGVSMRLTGHLGRLQAAAAALADGRRGCRAPEKGPVELRALALGFNTMADALTATLNDIERQVAERTLAAEAASRSKSAFLANMSHEIRTPMTAILGYAELVRSGEVGEAERAELMERIARNGEHLLTIINDILDLSKIEAGKMTIERTAIDPAAVLADVRLMLAGRAAERGLQFTTEVAPDVPRRVLCDAVRLRQILVNLVSNAMKFTEQGSVRVCMRGATVNGRPGLAVEVHDTGIGMDEPTVARLFQPFVQADESTTRKFGGTGLGLTISKWLAEALGGGLSAQSQPGAGSTFTLRITADPAPQPAAGVEHSASDPAPTHGADADQPLRGVRVLLVDDGPDNRRLFGHHLRKAGAEVTLATNGREAVASLTAAQAARVDVVLMDMQMPELDGYGATRAIRQAGLAVAVVALTAHSLAGEREKCLASGCNDYLTKPATREQLVAMVAKWADRTGARRTA